MRDANCTILPIKARHMWERACSRRRHVGFDRPDAFASRLAPTGVFQRAEADGGVTPNLLRYSLGASPVIFLKVARKAPGSW